MTQNQVPVILTSAGKFAGETTMSLAEARLIAFFPAQALNGAVEKLGFRSGDRGTHSSRTFMFKELEAVLAAAPGLVDRSAYADAIIEGNCLQKPTASTRRISNQRLGELYALDQRLPIFRVMRQLWNVDPSARVQLATLAALARDPLFMASAAPILALPIGAELQRGPLREALHRLAGERMNDATIDKVVRNVSSSWAQAGHMRGRTFKFRQRVHARPAALAFALWLGNAAGFRGEDLLTTGWVAALDCSPSSARGLAFEAKRLGLIEARMAGDLVEFGLGGLDYRAGRT